MTLLGLLHVAGGLMSLCLPETRLISFLNTPAVVPVAQCDGHWTAHNCAHCHNSPNCTPTNSIRNPNPLPESPIFSLLRCQESQMSYSGRESAMSDMSNPRLGERQLSMDELKVTVL
ncbi:uncharacterized protein LOC129963859 [Argiope bruennichi]|nr:uncharacterized protein LOC129963859 [Argiope bruennichi]